MRLYALCIGLLLLQSCNNEKKDILSDKIPVAALKEDIALLKKIVYSAHAGAFAYNTKEQLDSLFDSITASIATPITLADFYNKVDCITERLRCLHTVTGFPREFYDVISQKPMFFPISLMAIENKLYVNSSKYSIPLGAEIIAINNTKAADIIQRLQTYAHIDGFSNAMRSSAIDDDFAMNYYLAFGGADEFRIQFNDSASGQSGLETGAGQKLSRVNKDWYEDTYYFIADDAAYDFEMDLKTKSGIITIRTFDFATYATNTAFEHFLENSFRLIRQNGITHLVLDCRNNGGGLYASAYSFLSYLHPKTLKPFDSVIRRFDQLPYAKYVVEEDSVRASEEDTCRKNFKGIRSGVYALQEAEITDVPANELLYRGSIYLLVNGRVASAAADVAAILKEQPNVFVAGEETAGSCSVHNSYVFTYQLPNSHLNVDIPTRRYYQPVHTKQSQRGVIPNKQLHLTATDLVQYRDRAMEFIKDSFIRK